MYDNSIDSTQTPMVKFTKLEHLPNEASSAMEALHPTGIILSLAGDQPKHSNGNSITSEISKIFMYKENFWRFADSINQFID